MTAIDEQLKVLKMVEERKINAEEAVQLLTALDEMDQESSNPQEKSSAGTGQGNRWFRVRVTDINSGKTRANIRMPINLVSAGIKLGMKLSPDVNGVDPQQLVSFIQSGETGQVADIYDDEDDEHVEIFIE
jgi:hypothetical protein